MKQKKFLGQSDANAAASKAKKVKNARKSQLQNVSPYIALKMLARHFNLPQQGLSFVIAETPDGEDGIDLTPAVLIANSSDYIDLVQGIKQNKQVQAFGGIRTFVPAVVKYDNGNFVFSAAGINSTACVSKETLINNFGETVVSH